VHGAEGLFYDGVGLVGYSIFDSAVGAQ